MILPNLAPAVIRGRASGGLSPAGVRPSSENYFQACRCTCANGYAVCGQGEANTLLGAQSLAHENAAAQCQAQGSTMSGSPTYSSNPCL